MLRQVVFSFLSLSCVSAPAAEILEIRSYNRIFESKKITLADIVNHDSLDKESQGLLETVQLGDAPNIGEQRVFTNKAIAEAARRESIKKNWVLKIPRNVVIENRGYDLNKDSIKKELIAQWKSLCSDCEFNIKSIQLPAVPKKLSDRPWQLESEIRLPRGHYTRKMTIVGENQRPYIFWINGQIEVRKKVPVLLRSVNMNTRLNKNDFDFKWRDITFSTDSTPGIQDILGQKARYSMSAEDIIWSNSLVRERAVRRGDVVKVSVGEENWQVSVSAIIEQDGFIGDTVNLRNTQTKRLITGLVTGHGEVEIR